MGLMMPKVPRRTLTGAAAAGAARDGLVHACLEHCHSRTAMRRTLLVALVVGTVLTLVHDGGALLAGDLGALTPWKVAANYLVPWCVSSIGYISARRATATPTAP